MLGKLKLGSLIVVAVAIAALSITVKTQRASNQELRTRIETLQRLLVEATTINSDNLKTIDNLVARHNECVFERGVDRSANAITVSQLEEDLAALRQRPLIQREEVYRDPSCAELGSLDIALVCPAIASSVRERARVFGTD